MILQGMGVGSLILSGIGILSEIVEELIVGVNRGLCFIAEQLKGPKLRVANEGGALSRRSPMRIDIRW